jgi:filamentous hemagglutinin
MDGNAGLALYNGILFVAGATAVLSQVTQTFAGEGVLVYRSVDPATGRVVYVGITRNLAARAAAHLRSKGIEVEQIGGLENLSRADARAVEQVLIEYYGLGKNGGTLLNKIYSIVSTEPEYAAYLSRGRELLQQAGYIF